MCRKCPQPRLLPANLGAARAVVACATQWRYDASGQPTGLHYEGCLSVLASAARLRGAPPDIVDTEFEQVRIAERAFLTARAERRGGAHE